MEHCFVYLQRRKKLSDWAKGLLKTVSTDVNYELPAVLMEEISDKEDASELLAIVKMREDDPQKLMLSPNPLIAVFDRPSNRGNLGTVIRFCDAFGIDALLITGHAVDLYDPDVISSSLGSFFHVSIARVADHETLFSFIQNVRNQYSDLQIVGTTAHHEKNISDVNFNHPTVIMIGNETEGLNKTFKQRCDVLATIPMSNRSSASSLNVGCAATVVFYEANRQRAALIS